MRKHFLWLCIWNLQSKAFAKGIFKQSYSALLPVNVFFFLRSTIKRKKVWRNAISLLIEISINEQFGLNIALWASDRTMATSHWVIKAPQRDDQENSTRFKKIFAVPSNQHQVFSNTEKR